MDSKTYWKTREETQRRQNIRDERRYAKKIDEIYQDMLDQVNKEIESFYARYAKKEGISMAEAKRRASKLDMAEYSRKAKKYVKEKDFSDKANEEMRLYNLTMKVNRLELLKANIGLEMVAGFDELEKYYDTILTERAIQEYERQAGILGMTVLNNAKKAHAIVDASFHNARFSDRIWFYQDLLKKDLEKLLATGLIQGKHSRVLAREISKRFSVSRSNAERLMVTEMRRVQTEAQRQSFERNGFEEYEFLALGTACPICKALDGKHFKVKKMLPGTNAPPMHPCCRCSVSVWMDDAEYERWLDSYQEYGLDFDSWKKKKFTSVNDSDIITPLNKDGVIDVHKVGKIDRRIFQCVTKDIVTDEVIITDERIQHIKDRHPNDYEKYYNYLRDVVEKPDYIIEANKPNTALILKEIKESEEKQFKTILRITTSVDNPDFKNSIITFMKINDKEWNRLLRNKKILYKK